jgi:hypothetical protein
MSAGKAVVAVIAPGFLTYLRTKLTDASAAREAELQVTQDLRQEQP